MKKSALIPLAFATLGVVAAPAAFAADNMGNSDNPDYQSQRKNIDEPGHVEKEYNKAMENKSNAKMNPNRSENSPNYDAERRNIDNPGHVEKEYDKTMKKEGGTKE